MRLRLLLLSGMLALTIAGTAARPLPFPRPINPTPPPACPFPQREYVCPTPAPTIVP